MVRLELKFWYIQKVNGSYKIWCNNCLAIYWEVRITPAWQCTDFIHQSLFSSETAWLLLSVWLICLKPFVAQDAAVRTHEVSLESSPVGSECEELGRSERTRPACSSSHAWVWTHLRWFLQCHHSSCIVGNVLFVTIVRLCFLNSPSSVSQY